MNIAPPPPQLSSDEFATPLKVNNLFNLDKVEPRSRFLDIDFLKQI